MEFQTRDDSGQITLHQSLNDAINHCKKALAENCPVWKISFTIPETGERVRLVRTECGWTLEDIYGRTPEDEDRDIAERHARGEKCIPGDWDCACCGLADIIADGLCHACWIRWIGLHLKSAGSSVHLW